MFDFCLEIRDFWLKVLIFRLKVYISKVMYEKYLLLIFNI